MQIKRLELKNWLGLEEFALDPKKINIFVGPKASGKTSIIEGLETTFTNQKRRTEVIKHGTDEATLFVKLDDGLEISRKVREGKADYLKIRKDNDGVPSTEKFLRQFINGDIFRPLDWVNMSAKEQTKSILNMLKIDWSQEDIKKWFGEIPSNVDFNQHILMVLKAIETKYYGDREEVNRKIKELKTQIEVIKKDLPANYDGEEWRSRKLQELYHKVSEAQEINKWIEQAKVLQQGINTKIEAIKANAENEKSKISLIYKDKRQDIKDIIDLSKSKIEKANEVINNVGQEQNNARIALESEEEKEVQKVREKYRNLVLNKVKEIQVKADEQKDLISIQESKIAAKQQELSSLDELEYHEKSSIDEKGLSEIEKEKLRVGKAADYLKEHEPINIKPLQEEADKVAEMQSFLRQWDMIGDIENQLAEKERYSADLTAKVNTARTTPKELLKVAKMPIDGISVDEKGLIRINGTLIDGLSDGEKLQLSFKIAKAQCGDLNVICIDKWESLNKVAQQELLKEMEDDNYQYFITEVADTESNNIEVEQRGDK